MTAPTLERLHGNRRHGHASGNSISPTYRVWCLVKRRCMNVRAEDYSRYGARGVTLCERWMSFETFLEDMGERPSTDHSIDRIDGSRGYEPGNCRWATRTTQNRNRRRSRFSGKLTMESAREIRRRHAAGEHFADIAMAFGIHKRTVSKVVSFENWQEVAGE